MRAMHEHPVPKESKEEEKTKRCNECDEEFFPVHNLFRLRFLLNPIGPERLHRKTLGRCRSKISYPPLPVMLSEAKHLWLPLTPCVTR